MPTKEQILFEPATFNKEELADAIRNGIVTYDELCATNEGFPHSLRVKVKDLIESQEIVSKEEQDKEIWSGIPRYDIDAVRNFIDMYPENMYILEAKSCLDKLLWEKVPHNVNDIQKFIDTYPESAFLEEAQNLLNQLIIPQVTIQKLLKKINKYRNLKDGEDKIKEKIVGEVKGFVTLSYNHKKKFLNYFKEHLNLLNQSEVKELYDEKILTQFDLEYLIDEDFLELFLEGEDNEELPSNTDIKAVEEVSTEFYFWGGPGSGKTCLMAALLSAANSGECPNVSSLIPKRCNSGDYMARLKTYFQGNDVVTLMERTHSGNINAMEFSLNDGKKEHPITFVDMPGEVLEDMYFDRNNKQNQSARKQQLEDMHTLLKGNNNNHKIHFFIVEYGAENKLNKKTGLPQNELLEHVAEYIKELGLFEKETDLIMIILTKADLAPEGTKYLEYIDSNFSNFKGNLKYICTKNHINAGKVDWRKFSLGQVVFQKYARFNKKDALKILDVIVDRTWTKKNWFIRTFGG